MSGPRGEPILCWLQKAARMVVVITRNVSASGDRCLRTVQVAPAPLDQFAGVLRSERAEELLTTAGRARELLAGRVVWNVNSTASGGGVAEMLRVLLAYGQGAGVDTRWLVLDGNPNFFSITKRLHNLLHGAPGDGGFLGEAERSTYEGTLGAHRNDLRRRIRPGDIVLLHDPQTAGLVEVLQNAGAHVVWRCHVGTDLSNANTELAWAFLRPYVELADAFVFSQAAYFPTWVPVERRYVIAPSIDPFSAKNTSLSADVVARVLRLVGLEENGAGLDPVEVTGRTGVRSVVQNRTGLVFGGLPPPPSDSPLVVQVSRWDRLKGMSGVMTAFTEFVAESDPAVHLLLVGPAVDGVADDPEGAVVLRECSQTWEQLPAALRRRVHLVRVPMQDLGENAVIVNAVQRRASVVLQKSLAEGFGLTVTEAMWKARPVVAGAVGGIPEQIESGVHGLLVDPLDLNECGQAIIELLGDSDRASRLGVAAQARVRETFLGDRHLGQYVALFQELLG